MSSADPFFSQKNEAMLQRVLYNDICRRIGGDLTEKQATRLIKTVKHYMGEVHRVNGETQTASVLNREVLKIVLPDYLQYMERTERTSSRSVMSDMEEGPGVSQQISGLLKDGPGRIEERSQLDVTTAFSKLQASRQDAKPKVPAPTDFRLSLQDDAPVNMDLFERMKQEREQESLRAATLAATGPTRIPQTPALLTGQQGQTAYAEAGDVFSSNQRRMDAEAEAAFADRERKRLEMRATSSGALPAPPDMRTLFLGDRESLNRSAGNPTLALPDRVREPTGGLQQMIITREPETMVYKENELNLFVYSADRDWSFNNTETRYNFTVNFDPANMPSGLRVSPTSTVKFRNIVRIELVKAILPGESVDPFVTRTYSGSAFSYSTPYNMNVLSFPYIQVRIPELDTNNYGTNLALNASFGVLQYDANWIYDTDNGDARGYFAMIPKFLKCQKVYTPTPLATLQKLSFRFERPDGSLVSAVPDTISITNVNSSKEKTATTGVPYGYDSAVENGTGSAYYFIKTSTYFNSLMIAKGDRIAMKNIGWTAALTGTNATQAADLLNWLQQESGLLVVDVGYGGSMTDITIGPNSQGYANYIIVRGKFTDPTTGSIVTQLIGGVADSSTPSGLTAITNFISANPVTSGRLINLSKQVQIVLRVITREMDSTGILRPDNL